MKTLKFKITNITCNSCIKLSTMVLKKIPGVSEVKIESTGEVEIEYENEIDWKTIEEELKSVGKIAEKIS